VVRRVGAVGVGDGRVARYARGRTIRWVGAVGSRSVAVVRVVGRSVAVVGGLGGGLWQSSGQGGVARK